MSRQVLTVTLLLTMSAIVGTERAAAAPCGTVDPDTNQVARAMATLDEKSAVTVRTLKRQTGKTTLSLIFDTIGCELVDLEPPPQIRMLPQKGMSDLPDDAWTLKRAEVDGSVLELILTVDPEKFSPGSYGNLASIRAPYLASNRTPIAVSRSEANVLKPIGIGALAAFVSFLWFAALKFVSRAKLQVSWWWLAPVAVLAVGAGTWGVVNSYWDQDVWTVGDNWRATAVAGFTGGSTGAIAAVLGTIWLAPKKE